MAFKDSKQNPEENRLNVISLLLAYSMKADRKDVFIKTLEGEDMRTILKNDAIKKNITSGCGFFADEDTNKDIEKIRQSLEAVTGNNTNSINTYKPPP